MKRHLVKGQVTISVTNARVLLVIGVAYHFFIYGIKTWKHAFWIKQGLYFAPLREDIMISMRYANNLANGYGLVWNVGERVEGYTNFLWTLVLTIPHVLNIPVQYTFLFPVLLNILFFVGSLLLLYKTLRFLYPSSSTNVFLGMASFSLFLPYAYWGSMGFETSLLVFLTVLLLYLSAMYFVSNSDYDKYVYYISMVLSAGWLTRDSYLLIWLSYLVAIVLRGRYDPTSKGSGRISKLIYPVAVIPLLVKVGHEIFRYTYYGDIFPNTFYLKALNWNKIDQVSQGITYSSNFLIELSPLFLLFALLLVNNAPMWSKFVKRLSRATKFALEFSLCAILLQTAYVTWVGGDKFINFRFYIVLLPFLTIMLVAVLEAHRKNTDGNHVQMTSTAFLLLNILFIMNLTGGVKLQRFNGGLEFIWNDNETVTQVKELFGLGPSGPLTVSAPERNIRTAIEILENPALNSKHRVAVFQAGTLPYFLGSQYYCIDLLGKMDPHIARLRAFDGFSAGHNKWDISYSIITYHPDIIVNLLVIDREKPIAPQIKRFQNKRDFLGALSRNDTFLQNYKLFPYIFNGYDIYTRK